MKRINIKNWDVIEREVTALWDLNHENIVKLHEVIDRREKKIDK